jgi:hypothetical protein
VNQTRPKYISWIAVRNNKTPALFFSLMTDGIAPINSLFNPAAGYRVPTLRPAS